MVNTKLVIVLSIITVVIIGVAYGIMSYEEPKYIKVCIESHIEQVYQPPVLVNTGNGVTVPVGGGMVDRTVCDKYEMQNNPKYGQ